MELTSGEWLCNTRIRALERLVFLILMTGALHLVRPMQARAEVGTTTVQGTVYLANGQAGSGMLHVSWPGFTTANGQAVVADSADVTIGQDGFLSVNLAPNQGAMPAGLYYTAVFYMSDGSVSTQYWVVPAAAQATLAQVQAQVMPAAQAVQAVNKSYVDQAIAQVSQTMLAGSGGTLTGPLFLSGDPTQALQAADKHYVDSAVSLAATGGGSSNVNPGSPGQIAFYADNGSSLSGMNTVPVGAGGTGSTTSSGALQNLGGISFTLNSAQAMAGPLNLSAPYDTNSTNMNQAATEQNVVNVAPRSVKEFGAKGNGVWSGFVSTAGSKNIVLTATCCGYDFSTAQVGYLIALPGVDSDHKTLYTTITSITDSMHATVATAPTYSLDSSTNGTTALWMADDTAAIAAAISGVRNQPLADGSVREGGGTVIFPCGYYGTTSQVSVPGGITVEGVNRDCAVIMYMGTAAVDAAMEVSPGAASNWLHNGLYINPGFNNHPEIGACSGANCSPVVPSGSVTGAVHDLTIYGNKYSNWDLSIMFPANYQAYSVTMFGGNTGCFYTINDVQATYTHLFCANSAIYGNGNPVNGLYFDGTGSGQGIIPTHVQSPWVTGATGTAITLNYTGGMSIADGQISVSHQSLHVFSSAGGLSMKDTLLEAGQIADAIDCSNNFFIGTGFTGAAGLSVSGGHNLFIDSDVANGSLTITGGNNTFAGMDIPTSVSIDNESGTTQFENLYADNIGAYYNFPQSEESAGIGNGDAAVTRVRGFWRASTTPVPITSTHLTNGQAWRAMFIGNWSAYGVQTSIPPVLELTDTNNTVTVGAQTFTFSIGGNKFVVQSGGSDNYVNFTGFVYLMPRGGSSGSGGTNSMKLAGAMQSQGVQISTGSVMTNNHGNGSSVQHSDGTGTSGNAVVFDANGNVTNGPALPPSITGTIASGSISLATSAIASGACQAVTAGSVNSASASGIVTTDTITFTPNGSIKGVSGFTPSTSGGLTITAYPTAGFVNFDVCNWTGTSITPGAVTLNWKVTR